MSRRELLPCAIAFAAFLAGCASTDTSLDVAALRTNVDDRSTRELQGVVSSALDGVAVTIAEDALTRESTLIIERGLRRSVDRGPELGRDLGRPNHFRLILDSRQCFLVHEETGLRWMLADTECTPE